MLTFYSNIAMIYVLICDMYDVGVQVLIKQVEESVIPNELYNMLMECMRLIIRAMLVGNDLVSHLHRYSFYLIHRDNNYSAVLSTRGW